MSWYGAGSRPIEGDPDSGSFAVLGAFAAMAIVQVRILRFVLAYSSYGPRAASRSPRNGLVLRCGPVGQRFAVR